MHFDRVSNYTWGAVKGAGGLISIRCMCTASDTETGAAELGPAVASHRNVISTVALATLHRCPTIEAT
jgi:hypothetical protein